MDTPQHWLDCLKVLAASDAVSLEDVGQDALDDLVARGLIQKDERPKQASLESRYEHLQDVHRHFLEARGCVDRLQRRMVPRTRLVGLISAIAPAPPSPEDPDVMQLFSLLEDLRIRIRGLGGPEDVPNRLNSIQEYLQVEGRECLDRLADTDREIDLVQKETPPGTLVESVGFFTLTPTGEAALPEARVIEGLETALQAAFGPLASRSAYGSHFREDPASLLSFLLEGMDLGTRPSALLSDYEALLEALERIGAYREIRNLRVKIGFVVRLLRASRSEPKQAFFWCNRERLAALLGRMRPLVPSSIAKSGWQLPYAVDLFLVDGGLHWDEGEVDRRARLCEAVQKILSDLLQDVRIADGQYVRLGIILTHAARVRNFAPGILMDRFIRQSFEVIQEAANNAPYTLGDRGTRLMFGAHLAHAAGFAKAQLPGPIDTFTALQARLQEEGNALHIPMQALLHMFTTLNRLDQLGSPVSLETYANAFWRVRKRLDHNKLLSRAFRTEHTLEGDEAGLISNLCARVFFQSIALSPKAQFLPDAGMAGFYERRLAGLPPIMGSPMGTLMLP
jgi:hypothetical protein